MEQCYWGVKCQRLVSYDRYNAVHLDETPGTTAYINIRKKSYSLSPEKLNVLSVSRNMITVCILINISLSNFHEYNILIRFENYSSLVIITEASEQLTQGTYLDSFAAIKFYHKQDGATTYLTTWGSDKCGWCRSGLFGLYPARSSGRLSADIMMMIKENIAKRREYLRGNSMACKILNPYWVVVQISAVRTCHRHSSRNMQIEMAMGGLHRSKNRYTKRWHASQ